jgi:NIPSNAP protein
MASAMIFLHETHEISGGRMETFETALRETWRPLVEEDGAARLCWAWHHTHGTGPSYQMVTITAVRDWPAWAALAERMASEPRWRAWHRDVGDVRREVTAKLLRPTAWSPLQEVELATPPAPAGDTPGLYLHDTGWPFPGQLDAYVDALGQIFHPQTRHARMISIAACWTVMPGTGRHHEVVLLQRIEDWPQFSRLITQGERGAQRAGWMLEGLRYRDRWESKLLRCALWSPRQ